MAPAAVRLAHPTATADPQPSSLRRRERARGGLRRLVPEHGVVLDRVDRGFDSGIWRILALNPATNGNATIGHMAGVTYDLEGGPSRSRSDQVKGRPHERSPSGEDVRRGVEAKGRVT